MGRANQHWSATQARQSWHYLRSGGNQHWSSKQARGEERRTAFHSIPPSLSPSSEASFYNINNIYIYIIIYNKN